MTHVDRFRNINIHTFIGGGTCEEEMADDDGTSIEDVDKKLPA